MGDKQDQPLGIVTTQRDTELSEKDTEEENLFRRQNQKDTQLRKQACQSLSVQTKEERRVSHN